MLHNTRALRPLPFLRRGAALGSPNAARFFSFGPPKQPINFGTAFAIEPFKHKLDLETFNAHPRDKRLVFDDKAHSYFFDGKQLEQSVTKKVESYFEKFDASLVADKMMNGANWPRNGYKHKDDTPFTKEDILEKWDKLGAYARNKGTWIHHNIERHFNHMDVSPSLPEMEKFLKFEAKMLHARQIKPYRTEWKIAAENENLGGTVDYVGKKTDGTYVLIDWKSTTGLGKKFSNDFEKVAKEPLEHLADCDGLKYALQLNIYRYILQKYYGLVISELRVASFSYQESSYFTTTVHMMDDELELIFPPSDEELARREIAFSEMGQEEGGSREEEEQEQEGDTTKEDQWK
jgi:hypothetical protein